MPNRTPATSFDLAVRSYRALAGEVKRQGGSDTYLDRIATDQNLRRQLAELIIGYENDLIRGQVLGDCEVLVDYAIPITNLVVPPSQAYLYDRRLTSILDHSDKTGTETVTINMIRFKLDASTADRDTILRKYGEPCTLREMLCFISQYPPDMPSIDLVFLGNNWRDAQDRLYTGWVKIRADYRSCILSRYRPGLRWPTRTLFAFRDGG